MKSKKNLIILAIVIAISLLGITYAFFDYYMLGSNQKITAGKVNLVFNEGEDTIDRGNIFPETVEKARSREDNFITFTVSGVNTTEDQDIYYEIMLNEGDPETGMTRFNPEDLVFDLVELNDDGTEGEYVVDALSFTDFNARRIWVDTITKNTSTTLSRTYKLRMWLSEVVKISDTNTKSDYPSTGYENYYASVKVSVYGDFVEKSVPYNYMINLNNVTAITEQKSNISEVHFISLTPDEINRRVAASTINADVTDTSLGGSVKAWLENDTTDTSKYIMYVASDGTTYFPSNCSTMFLYFNNLVAISFENINTSNVTNMSVMFNGCSNLKELDLSMFDTSNVTNMANMFMNCSGLTSLELSHFNTSQVTDMMSMFSGCSGLTNLNLSSFDTKNVTRFDQMFFGCTALLELDATSIDFSLSSTSYNGMFVMLSSNIILKVSSEEDKELIINNTYGLGKTDWIADNIIVV